MDNITIGCLIFAGIGMVFLAKYYSVRFVLELLLAAGVFYALNRFSNFNETVLNIAWCAIFIFIILSWAKRNT